jgi:TrkA domain protein
MDVTESDLPGVGKKHEVGLGDGRELVIVTHNTGNRRIYLKESPDADSEELLTLSDRQARTVGTILEGAYFQPVQSDQVETLLADERILEWFAVDDQSPLVGETLESAAVGKTTGATVVAIERGDEVVAAPGPQTTVEAGDTLVVIGDSESCDRLEELLAGEQ